MNSTKKCTPSEYQLVLKVKNKISKINNSKGKRSLSTLRRGERKFLFRYEQRLHGHRS